MGSHEASDVAALLGSVYRTGSTVSIASVQQCVGI